MAEARAAGAALRDGSYPPPGLRLQRERMRLTRAQQREVERQLEALTETIHRFTAENAARGPGRQTGARRPNPRGLDWLLAVRDMLDAELDGADRELFGATIRDFDAFDTDALPGGAIHADLFHDNALFVAAGLGGIFDFDYACSDSFVFDIAVVLNDWCVDTGGRLDVARVRALIAAYRQIRGLDKLEIDALPLMLRFSALRFWLSRLHDKVFPRAGELTFIKDPNEFRRLLVLRTDPQQALERLVLPHHVG